MTTELPENTLAILEIEATEEGGMQVKVNMRKGMSGEDFADLLRTIADGYEMGTMRRLE